MKIKTLFLIVLGVSLFSTACAMDQSSHKEKAFYLYWQKASEGYPLGHAELAVEDRRWSAGQGEWLEKGSLGECIARVKEQDSKSMSFYCYEIQVTPQELNALKEDLKENESCWGSCSYNALKKLRQYTRFKVPFFLTIAPVVAFIYLSLSKFCGVAPFTKVEFYENPKTSHLGKRGMVGEIIIICSWIWNFYYFSALVAFCLSKVY